LGAKKELSGRNLSKRGVDVEFSGVKSLGDGVMPEQGVRFLSD